jgi:hypothetical protein
MTSTRLGARLCRSIASLQPLPSPNVMLRERGLDAGAMDDTTSDKVMFATVTDPDGNAITLVEQR